MHVHILLNMLMLHMLIAPPHVIVLHIYSAVLHNAAQSVSQPL